MLANGGWDLTLILLRWTIWRAPTNASKWRMGFNSSFKGLIERCELSARFGSVKVKAVTMLPVTGEALVRFLSRSCGVCGGHDDNGRGLSAGTAISPPESLTFRNLASYI